MPVDRSKSQMSSSPGAASEQKWVWDSPLTSQNKNERK